jgi:uncharacterized membrane protein YccC
MSGPILVWSPDAALRALRATIVVPTLFALTFEVIGNSQMALFAVFGSFAALVLTTFGGTRRDKAVAHLGLAVAGSVVLIIGTLVSGITWLAALVTVPVAFAVFLGGVAGPNASLGVTAALLAYVLPVASAGGLSTIPSRLAGWWLASVVSTAAVLLLSRRSAGDGLRSAAAACAAALASHLAAVGAGGATQASRAAAGRARSAMMTLFVATPYRPTGLATADQALASVVHLLEWCTSLSCDYLSGHPDPISAADADLVTESARVLRDVAGLLDGSMGESWPDPRPGLLRLEDSREASLTQQLALSGDHASVHALASNAVHAQSIAVTVEAVAADALIASRHADPKTIADVRRRWYGATSEPARGRIISAMTRLVRPARSHANIRSVWFRNSVRGALALALAVAAADLIGVQHGFWVVLGTLSVLRSNAVSTGSTVLRALLGTAAGFVIGAGVLLAIGTGPVALWAVLPVAVLVASYAPGTAPFEIGQAGFTVTVVVLFNLLVPAGWQVGLLRVEDVGLGCAVSLAVGILFWPHGASSVVGDNLADAFRRGGNYLTEAVDWALGVRAEAPDAAVATVSVGIRLDDALRAFLAEQGAKRVSKDDLWTLVMATTRLRLTAYSVAGLPGPNGPNGHTADADAGQLRILLADRAAGLAGFYDRIAGQVGPPNHDQLARIAVPVVAGSSAPSPGAVSGQVASGHVDPRTIWVSDHLHHLSDHADTITGPAVRLAGQRRAPWWR